MWMRTALEESLPAFVTENIPNVPSGMIEEMLSHHRVSIPIHYAGNPLIGSRGRGLFR